MLQISIKRYDVAVLHPPDNGCSKTTHTSGRGRGVHILLISAQVRQNEQAMIEKTISRHDDQPSKESVSIFRKVSILLFLLGLLLLSTIFRMEP